MSATVFFAVVAAAALHAVWNALAKGGLDTHLIMTAVALGHTPIAVATLAFVPALRETSITFALVIGVWFLGEKLNLAKVFTTFVTLLGAAMLRLNKAL